MKLKFCVCLLSFFSALTYGQTTCLNFHAIDTAPLGFVDSAGEIQGMHVDFLEVIAKKSEICINIQLMPYARILRSLEDGAHDGGILFKYPQREKFIEFVAHIQNMQTVVVARPQFPLSSFAALNNLVIATTRGTDLSDNITLVGHFNVVELTNYEQASEMLHKGRIDAVAGSAFVLFYQLSKYTSSENTIDFSNKLVLGSREVWLQVSKNSPSSIDTVALKKATEMAIADLSYDKIMQKYYGHNWRHINQQ